MLTAYDSAVIDNYSYTIGRGSGMAIYMLDSAATIYPYYTSSNFLFLKDTHWRTFLSSFESRTAPTANFVVSTSTPSSGSIVSTAPTSFNIYFNKPYDASSVKPTDLTVNSVPADSVQQTSSTELTFVYNTSPVSTPGTYAMAIAAGALRPAAALPRFKRGTSASRWLAPLPKTLTITSDGKQDDAFLVTRNGNYVDVYINGVESTSTPALLSSVSEIIITGSAKNDTLTVDYSGGNPVPSGGLGFDGGGGSGDAIAISKGDFTSIVDSLGGANSGTLSLGMTGSSTGTIVYENVAMPVALNVSSVADLTFNPAGPNTDVALGDNSQNLTDVSQLSGSTFNTTTFTDPHNSLTVDLGSKGDTITVQAMNSSAA